MRVKAYWRKSLVVWILEIYLSRGVMTFYSGSRVFNVQSGELIGAIGRVIGMAIGARGYDL